jgi:hypothetical protein
MSPSQAQLAAGWLEVLAADAGRFEAPDPLGHRDTHHGFLRTTSRPRIPARPFPIPRRGDPGAGIRHVAILDPGEHAEYRAVVGRLAPGVERALGPGVMGNRALRAGPHRALRVEPWRRARARYLGAVRRLAGGCREVVVADVRDCFRSVSRDSVWRALWRLGAPRDAVERLDRFLRRFEADGGRGLPIGPEPSAIVCNAVLGEVDRALGPGVLVLRWVDDFVVVPAPGRRPEEVLEELVGALGATGLDPAPEKTGVIAAERLVQGMEDRTSGAPGDRPGPSLDEAWARVAGTGGTVGRSLSGEVAALRALGSRRWGWVERELLVRVGESATSDELLRAWAWRAVSATDPGSCIDRAADLTDQPPVVARSVVAGAALHRSRTGELLLRHIRTRGEPNLRATAEWAQATGGR